MWYHFFYLGFYLFLLHISIILPPVWAQQSPNLPGASVQNSITNDENEKFKFENFDGKIYTTEDFKDTYVCKLAVSYHLQERDTVIYTILHHLDHLALAKLKRNKNDRFIIILNLNDPFNSKDPQKNKYCAKYKEINKKFKSKSGKLFVQHESFDKITFSKKTVIAHAKYGSECSRIYIDKDGNICKWQDKSCEQKDTQKKMQELYEIWERTFRNNQRIEKIINEDMKK